MKYVNAADVLPPELLIEVSKYSGGKLLYVPTLNKKYSWGEKKRFKAIIPDKDSGNEEIVSAG